MLSAAASIDAIVGSMKSQGAWEKVLGKYGAA